MAIETRVICDFCERPLDVTITEENGKKVENVQLHMTKEWDTRRLFPHLCASCAEKLDKALVLCENGVTSRRYIMQQNDRLNKERREKLGTKG